MSEIEDRRQGYRALEEECARFRAEINYRDRALIRMTAINDELVAMLKAVKPHSPPSWQVEIAAALARARGEG